MHNKPTAVTAAVFLCCALSLAAADPPAAGRTGGPATQPWGQEHNGLRTRLTAPADSFRAGYPVPLRLELENVGKAAKEYTLPAVPMYPALTVVDEQGRSAPYLGGLAQTKTPTKTIEPGQVQELGSFDLADWFYLRRPGKYIVKWPGGPLPASAELRFEVVANPAAQADGDPVGRLLPLVKDRWWLAAANKEGKVRPGSNRQEVAGRSVCFEYNPTGHKNDSGLILLWLTEVEAAEQPAAGTWPPPSESIGKIARWHVYVFVDANAAKAWPAAREDIKRGLADKPD